MSKVNDTISGEQVGNTANMMFHLLKRAYGKLPWYVEPVQRDMDDLAAVLNVGPGMGVLGDVGKFCDISSTTMRRRVVR